MGWLEGHVRLCALRSVCLWDPMDCSPPGSSVHGIPRQEYWSELTFPAPGDLPAPGIGPVSLASPVADSLPLATPEKLLVERESL